MFSEHRLTLFVVLVASWALVICGADKIKIEQAPYLLQVYCDGEFCCSAVLLNEKKAVAPATCFESNSTKIEVIAGKELIHIDTEDGIPEATTSADLHKHPDFKIYEISSGLITPAVNDIAILTFKTPLKLSEKIQPVKLPENSNKQLDIKEGLLSGWRFELDLSTLEPVDLELFSTNAKILDEDICRNKLSVVYINLAENNYCASTKNLPLWIVSPGTPFTYNGVLYGILSYFTIADGQEVSLFVNIGKYLDFINKF